MLLMIKVKPARHLRAQFARWAVAQDPKVDTCSHAEFCVPPDLFTLAPEELLIGSYVNGHRYRSPLEDEQQVAALAERESTPGQPLPELPPEAYSPGGTLLEPVEPVEPVQAPTESVQAPVEGDGAAPSTAAKGAPRRAPAAGAARRRTTPRGSS